MLYKSIESSIRNILVESVQPKKKAGAGEIGTDELTKTYSQATPGQGVGNNDDEIQDQEYNGIGDVDESAKDDMVALAAAAMKGGFKPHQVRAGTNSKIKATDWDNAAQNGGKIKVPEKQQERRMVTINRGGYSIRKAVKEDESLEEKYVGFKKLEGKLDHKGVKDPAALAAYIGEKKYGKKKFEKHAHEGKKLKEEEQIDESGKAELAALAAAAMSRGVKPRKVETGVTSGIDSKDWKKAMHGDGGKVTAQYREKKEKDELNPSATFKGTYAGTKFKGNLRKEEEEVTGVEQIDEGNPLNKEKKNAVIVPKHRIKDKVRRDFDPRDLKKITTKVPFKPYFEEETIEADHKEGSLVKTPSDRKAQQKIKIIDERKNLGSSEALIEASRLIGEASRDAYIKKLEEEIAYKKANGYIKND
ncbi:MAG: hypothetical protein P4L79_10765 [Legionella sp.]|uniref:hypothetical protein n=1 Tax=Legionella sp. TaxID=459 RepID=UPI002844C6F6|nr:hypothetical protein [Legionella sp.]